MIPRLNCATGGERTSFLDGWDDATLLAGRRVIVLGAAWLVSWRRADASILRDPSRASADVPAGAGRLAAQLSALGAQVRLISVAGSDGHGIKLREALEERGVKASSLVTDDSIDTFAEEITILGPSEISRVRHGQRDAAVSPAADSALAVRLFTDAAWADLVMVYGRDTAFVGPKTHEVLKILETMGKLSGTSEITARAAVRSGSSESVPA